MTVNAYRQHWNFVKENDNYVLSSSYQNANITATFLGSESEFKPVDVYCRLYNNYYSNL